MKNRNYSDLTKLTFCFFILATLTFISSCEKTIITPPPQTDKVSVILKFEDGVELSDISSSISKHENIVFYVETLQKKNGIKEFSSSKELSTINSLHEKLMSGRRGMVEDVKKDWSDSTSMPDIFSSKNSYSDLIRAIGITAEESIVNEIANKHSALIQYNPEVSDTNDQTTMKSGNGWIPKTMLVQAYDSGSGIDDRYLYQQMSWNSDSPFSFSKTFEPDLFLNNYDESTLGSGTYLSRDVTYWGFPVIEYASSSLPKAYLDTRFFDGNDFDYEGDEEVAYTIGSGKARSIDKDIIYFTYMRLNEGDADQDNAKLFIQRGTQMPIGCYSTWCSFLDFGTNIRITPSQWGINFPGVTSYNIN